MATANIKAFCSSCGKPNGRVTCEGCSKLFCLNDFNGHRQELGTQLDKIEGDRDLFRQMLTENISKPQNHALMKQIDEWENESIKKIRQAAGEARQILIDHTAKLHTKLEEKLEMLTNELRQSRKENDFFEPNLNQWIEELVQMKDELTKPSNITIQNDSTPLVTKITVDILDGRRDQKSDGTRHVAMKNKNAGQVVSCSFCNEECSSSAIGEHLMICGNKTDQCPNCKKYIRQAILAYHCENNCANLDEFEPDVNAALNQSEILSTFDPNYPPSFLSRPSGRNDTNTITEVVDPATLPNLQTVPTSQRSNSGRMTYISCRYCNQEFDPLDSGIHQRNCLRNPKNMVKKQESQNNPISNQNTGRLNHVDQSNDNTDIPCQYCNKPIKWRDYHNHTQACVTQHYPSTLERPRPIYTTAAPETDRCRHCNNQYMINCITYHEKNCKQNPDNIAREEQLRALYYPPPK